MSRKIKVILSVFIFILSTIALLIIFLPTTYKIDKKYLVKNENYNVVKIDNNKYISLAKVGSNNEYLDDDFKIIAFTDMHLDTYKKRGNYSINLMIRNIVNEKPDLVIFLGDIITSSFNKRRTIQLAKVMEELGVYWTYAIGNHEHDNNKSITREKMMNIFSSYDHCLVDTSKKTVNDMSVFGAHNSLINLIGKDNKIIHTLYILDSGQSLSEEELLKYKDETTNLDLNSYDFIKDNQIAWYEKNVKDINNQEGRIVPSTIYIHIPLFEFKTAYEEITGEDELSPFSNFTYPKVLDDDNILISGKRRENVAHACHNSGLFEKVKELSSTKAIFAGHDHVNNYVLKYQGIILGYCESSGYSSYNTISKKGLNPNNNKVESYEDYLINGYSIYTYKNDGSIEIENIMNKDVYPEIQNDIYKVIKK